MPQISNIYHNSYEKITFYTKRKLQKKYLIFANIPTRFDLTFYIRIA